MKTGSYNDNKIGKDKITKARIYSWIVTILVPVVLVLTSMRLAMAPVFLHIEYSTPNFPPDPYGFKKEDRLYWSKIALDYLLNTKDISFLSDLHFTDGTPVYNERELHHMVDVKVAIQIALLIWLISIIALIFLVIISRRSDLRPDLKKGLSRGGWLTVVLIGGLIVVVLLSFGVFFVAFHNVFFEPGTWMFNFSDTLIRLFPERFWRDVFIFVGGLSMLSGLALGIIFQHSEKQPEQGSKDPQ